MVGARPASRRQAPEDVSRETSDSGRLQGRRRVAAGTEALGQVDVRVQGSTAGRLPRELLMLHPLLSPRRHWRWVVSLASSASSARTWEASVHMEGRFSPRRACLRPRGGGIEKEGHPPDRRRLRPLEGTPEPANPRTPEPPNLRTRDGGEGADGHRHCAGVPRRTCIDINRCCFSWRSSGAVAGGDGAPLGRCLATALLSTEVFHVKHRPGGARKRISMQEC